MPMNGGDELNGSIYYGGGTKKRHMGAHRALGVGIYHGWQQQENRKPKRNTKQTSKKTRKQSKNAVTKISAIPILSLECQNKKR